MPIHDFPPEILVHIFELGKACPLGDIGGSALLLPVSQVCATWRSISHRYPSLWNDVHLSSLSSPQKAHNLLARYDGPTLSVTLDDREVPPNTIAWWNVLNLAVTAQAPRLCELRFIGSTDSLPLFYRACWPSFPSLRSLEMVDSDSFPFSPQRQERNIDAPNLVTLSLTRTMPRGNVNYPCLRELRLTHCGFYDPSDQPDGLVEPLPFDLERLSITASPVPSWLRRDPETRLLSMDSRLTSLALCNLNQSQTAPGWLRYFLHIVRMPCLQRLEAAGLTGCIRREFIQALARRPGYPQLQVLTLRAISLPRIESGNSDPLFAVRSVVRIHLVDVDPKPLVRVLERDRAVCPNVTQLLLTGGAVLRLSSRAAV
ncbi:hypothetical protein B0H15DRAFT_577013 [Mycena belliarum]|uniref:F-box domain-containing protein n=1 Tax=Mycena belliarum TaxID=1033014 RepID=A0AAD6XG73_9AGAR|nr:hypothetical protein B0H15DRAFT_577013 [Mycena belliae]